MQRSRTRFAAIWRDRNQSRNSWEESRGRADSFFVRGLSCARSSPIYRQRQPRFFCPRRTMRNVRLIQSLRDENYRPTRRTIADGLDRLKQELGAEPKTGRCHLHVPHRPSGAASFAAIWFRADQGDDIIITYPFSKGCWALTTSGARIHLSLDQLDGALVDDHGNVFI